jgi:UTP:GlnB (protein PII) uridylyltransferase
MALPDAEVTFDNVSAPWHTVCTVRADDRSRALLAVVKAFALSEVNVVAARSTVVDGRPIEVLELADRRGNPISDASQRRILEILATGETPSMRRRSSGHRAPAS